MWFRPADRQWRTPTGRTRTPATERRPRISRWSLRSGTRRAATPGARDRSIPVISRLSLFGPLLLVVGGSLVYHVAAKSVPKTLDPVASVIGIYAAALAASIAMFALMRPGAVPGVAR